MVISMSSEFDKFLIPELPINTPICHTCKHWNGNLACKAFPKGIPVGVFTNEWDHRYPIRGDHGIQYEPEKGLDERN